MPLVRAALDKAQVRPDGVQAVLVGLGPGSYTGIRSSIALAQGWQLARGARVGGVSSVECLIAQAQAQGQLGRVSIVIDAQRQELYLATYEIHGGERRLIEPLHIASREQVRASLQANGSVLVGPEVTKWFSEGIVLVPEAQTLPRLEIAGGGWIRGEELTPIYLRDVSFLKAPPPRIIPP
jgi:tRNA threonylcarbamoyl adenosine modification protein YeaZ